MRWDSYKGTTLDVEDWIGFELGWRIRYYVKFTQRLYCSPWDLCGGPKAKYSIKERRLGAGLGSTVPEAYP